MEGAALPIECPPKRLLERSSDGSRDDLKSAAGLPAFDEARLDGDPVLPRVQGGLGTRRRCREGRDPRGLAVLQELQSPVRDQGWDPRPPPSRLQMNSACVATTAALSFALAYAARGSRFNVKNCSPQANFASTARA